jgi:hypothetical protein
MARGDYGSENLKGCRKEEAEGAMLFMFRFVEVKKFSCRTITGENYKL